MIKFNMKVAKEGFFFRFDSGCDDVCGGNGAAAEEDDDGGEEGDQKM